MVLIKEYNKGNMKYEGLDENAAIYGKSKLKCKFSSSKLKK